MPIACHLSNAVGAWKLCQLGGAFFVGWGDRFVLTLLRIELSIRLTRRRTPLTLVDVPVEGTAVAWLQGVAQAWPGERLRVRVKIMGSQQCRIVGKSQPVLV
eukprot:COSAG01_NODE_13740_length_1542_cov_1.462924_4_plen_101_part_01